MSSIEIGAFDGSYSYTDGVTGLEPTDIYQLPLLEPGNLRLSLGGLSAPVAVEVWDKETLLRTVEIDANNPEAINLYDLSPGNYSLEVARTNKNTGYTLNIDTLTGQQADSGFFVSDEESMTVDILTGENSQLEIAVVNLEGMEEFNPGSEAYIKEAARRSLSNSALGRVLVSGNGNQTELSAGFTWESEITGNLDGVPSRYQGTFTAQPGDKFALMAVKDNTIQDVFDNPQVNGSKSPVFSLGDAGGVGGFGISQSELANGTIFTIDKNGNLKETVIYIPKPGPEPATPVTEPTTPVTGGNNIPPVTGGNNIPPVTEQPTTPVTGKQYSASDGATDNASGGGKQYSASDGATDNASDGGKQYSASDGATDNASDGGKQYSASDGGKQYSASDGATDNASDGGKQYSASGGGKQYSASGGATDNASDGGSNIASGCGGK